MCVLLLHAFLMLNLRAHQGLRGLYGKPGKIMSHGNGGCVNTIYRTLPCFFPPSRDMIAVTDTKRTSRSVKEFKTKWLMDALQLLCLL